MVFDHKLQGAICHRLHVFGIPPVFHRGFATLVDKWVACSGVEWTVKRLKSLKVDLYRIRSGLAPLTPAKKRVDGSFYGVIGSLFRYAHLSERKFQSVVNTFMCYSLFKAPKLTESQKEKFVSAVNAQTSQYSTNFLKSFATFVKAQNKQLLKVGLPQPLMTLRGSSSKKAPIVGHRSMSQENSGLAAMSFFRSKAHMDLYRRYESLYSAVTYGVDINAIATDVTYVQINPHAFSVMGGEVHFLQEPGLKLRAIASPYLVHQQALQPLGSALYNHMRTLPWDCTFDHGKPVQAIQAHLSSKRTVHSVDLSNATDYFPLEVQVNALQALIGNHPSIDLFVEISRSLWLSTIGTIRWSQGQPLGLYPSFASFGLTHGYLLLYLLGKEYNNEFYVLGDDVVILDDLLYQKYLQALEFLGCPYSPDKSLSSTELSEFGGKIITSSAVHTAFKWREVSNDNFLDLVRNYGRRAESLLSASQKQVIEKVRHCVSPFGLNWSFPGSNLEVMTKITQSIYKQVDRDEQSLTELFSILYANYYSVPGSLRRTTSLGITGVKDEISKLTSSIDTEALRKLASTFDEKVAVTLQRIFPEEWVTAILNANLVGGYAGVPRAVGITDLPLKHLEPTRVTTLDRYRKILNLKG